MCIELFIVQGSLSAFIDRPAKSVTLRSNTIALRNKNEKQPIYDINCVVDGESVSGSSALNISYSVSSYFSVYTKCGIYPCRIAAFIKAPY